MLRVQGPLLISRPFSSDWTAAPNTPPPHRCPLSPGCESLQSRAGPAPPQALTVLCGGSDCVQEEEESPAEGTKEEAGEQSDLKEEAEAPAEGTSPPPTPEPKGDTAPEGEKAPDRESGQEPEAQVSCQK